MNKHLHIICFTVPYPVDYGGVFDLFYKLVALHQQGVKIHLHCFDYGRGKQAELNKYCESVHYYQRQTGSVGVSLTYPYIVNSRRSNELAQRLLRDDYPILMEGIHSTYLLNDPQFANRQVIVRLHNVEHIYYYNLYKNSTSLLKKLYYFFESHLLKSYERRIASKAIFASVTRKDAAIFRQLGCKRITVLPLFLPGWQVTGSSKGCFCLYQGDLSTAENEKAAMWLINEVFNDLDISFVIAGKQPSPALEKLVHSRQNICLVANPGEAEMQDLISKAHINIIPSYNATGIKLKLINALYNGRHCLVNFATIDGSELEAACNIAETTSEFKTALLALYNQPFTEEEVELRKQLLGNIFDNDKNAERLVDLLFALPKQQAISALQH